MAIELNRAIDLVNEFVHNYPVVSEIEFTLRETQEQLYGPQATIAAVGNIQGAYYPASGRAAFAVANFRDENEFEGTLRHEIIGHFGINTFTADEKQTVLAAIIAARNEPTMAQLWERIERVYPDKSASLQAEEIFAFSAEGIANDATADLEAASRAWSDVCESGTRPLTLSDLMAITSMVAEGLRSGTRSQQIFPLTNSEQFRKEDAMEKKSFHEVVAEKLIEQLKQGTAPWQRPWAPGEPSAFFPMNPTTGKRYKGINAIFLMAQGHGDQRWMTYKQAGAAGAQVRKGERGTPIQYWKFQEETPKTDAQGRPVLDARGEQVVQRVKLERPKVFHATVFNAEQIDGLPPIQRNEQERNWTAVERAEAILAASGATINHEAQNRAFYRPATDSIHLPEQGQFPTADNYYATALHELGHWTGHESRLARDLSHPFGSEGYAKEELRAEIASMILGDELGIGHDPGQHAAYVKSWITVLENDPLEIIRAAADAEKIHGYVLSLEQQQVQDQIASIELQREAQEATMQQPQHEAPLIEASTLGSIEHDNLAYTLEGASSKQLARVRDVLAVMVPLNTQNGFWQRHALPHDVDALEAKIEAAIDLVGRQAASIDLAAKSGTPMASMPGKRMRYNDQPGMAGAEIVNEDGSRLSFGNQEAIQHYAAANDLALADVRTLMALNARADRHRAMPEQLRYPSQYESTEGTPGRLHERLADTAMPYKDALLSGTWRDLQVSTDATREGDAIAFQEQSRRAFGFELPADWNGHVQVQANVMEGDGVVPADPGAGQEPEFYSVYAQHRDGTHQHLQDLPTLESAEIVAHRLAVVDAHAELSHPDQAVKLARLKEEAVRRNPATSDEQRDAAKEDRKQAEVAAMAADPVVSARLAQLDREDGHEPRVATVHPAPQSSGDAQDKTHLDVPYKERNAAKALGAKWDRREQFWFVPATVDLAPFARWAKDTQQPAQEPRNAQGDTQTGKAPPARQYLAVPYDDRAVAKAAGALWDKVVKSWYVGPQADAAQLQRWAPENVRAEQEPAMYPRDEFAEAMRAHGLVVEGEHPIMDGNKHRVPVEGGKKGAADGFYVLYPDGHPAGRIINNKTGADEKWKSKGYSLTPEQKAAMQAEAAANLARRAATLAEQQEQAAARVSRQFDALHPVEQLTPYLAAKGVQAHPGAFTDRDQKTTFIPVFDADNKLWSMQYIQEDGTKRFAKDSRKEGCFHAIGGLDALAKAPAIVIGEGYATAATLSEVLGFATVAAFDSGNLTSVAKALQAKFPDTPIVIAGDDDHHQEITEGKNPGREKMEEAAKAVGATKLLPIFAPGERDAHPNVFTDFNDLATKSVLGRASVERQVRAAVEAAIDKRSAGVERDQEQKQVRTKEQRRGQRPAGDEAVRQRRTAKI